MKKTILFGAAALVMLAACNKQETAQSESKTFTLSATVEQQEEPGTKSTLSGTTVSWTASADVIKVYNADGSANTDLTAQSSGTSTTFSGGDLSGVPTVAIFPAGIASGYNGSEISFTLPSSQDYVANSFDSDANVAVASVSASSLAFKNVCGTLKLSVTGNYTVSKIEVTGANNEKLWGAFKTTVATAPVLSVDGDPTNDEKTLTLNCGAGVALDPETATAFYIVVPQGVFASGFTAKIYSKEAEDAYETYTYTTVETTSANTVSRSRIRVMPQNTLLPPAYQKATHVAKTGTAWINTGIKMVDGIGAKVVVKFGNWNGSYDYVLGAYDTSSDYFGIWKMSENTLDFCYKYPYKNCTFSETDNYHTITNNYKNDNLWTVDGVEAVAFVGGVKATSDKDVYIFDTSYYTHFGSSFEIADVELTIGGNVVFHGIPCYSKEGGDTGLFDTVTGAFFGKSQGSGSLTPGADVNH